MSWTTIHTVAAKTAANVSRANSAKSPTPSSGRTSTRGPEAASGSTVEKRTQIVERNTRLLERFGGPVGRTEEGERQPSTQENEKSKTKPKIQMHSYLMHEAARRRMLEGGLRNTPESRAAARARVKALQKKLQQQEEELKRTKEQLKEAVRDTRTPQEQRMMDEIERLQKTETTPSRRPRRNIDRNRKRIEQMLRS